MAFPPELSTRDQAILRDLQRVRLLTGRQLERLHFANLTTANASSSSRRRSLHRLVGLRLVTTLPRRVGGERAGSGGLVYALDARALRLLEVWAPATVPGAQRIRRPWAIGWPFVAHTLAVSEIYVRLREHERGTGDQLLRYDAEPACWHQTPFGVFKPDAYTVYDSDAWEEHRWIEVDRGTESLPTVRRKLEAYERLVRASNTGPAGVLPRLLVTVPTSMRQQQIESLARRPGLSAFVTVLRFDDLLQAGRPPP